mmetsp:Transcript_8929/g.36125  ORF Transcript_8929/g.36125 Transcript_8929/m.36125 type:complete len:124 (-) Transcript_8929:235-606(-)
MASESIPRDPARGKESPRAARSSPRVAAGVFNESVFDDAPFPALSGDAPKPYVAFPAQEFCRDGRAAEGADVEGGTAAAGATELPVGEVPKPKSRRGGAGASADAGENGEVDALEGRKGPARG